MVEVKDKVETRSAGKPQGGDLFIVDNSDDNWKVQNYLREWTDIAHTFDIATGYFEIGALLALDGQWQKLNKLRILMGDEVTKRTKKALVAGIQAVARTLDISIEREKEGNDFLTGVPAIVEALKSKQIECRVYAKEKFHAKAYITHSKLTVVGSSALVGSSNFTYPGGSLICVAAQTAGIGAVRKLVLLSRLIIVTPSHDNSPNNRKIEEFVSLCLLNLRRLTTKQQNFSSRLVTSDSHRTRNNRKLRSPEAGFDDSLPTTPSDLYNCPPHSTAPRSDNTADPDARSTSSLPLGTPVLPGSGKPPAIPTATPTREIEAAEIPGRQSLRKSPDATGAVVDCLNMRGWRSTGITYERHRTVIHAQLLTELTHCRCDKCEGRCRSTKLRRHGWTNIQYLDHTPSDERPRVIAYHRQRYRCLECHHTSSQPVPGVYKGTEMTRQLRRYIARQALLPEESFSAVARRVGRSERSVRDVFEKHRAHLESVRMIETPRVMGLDGVYVRRQESLIVVDLERKRPVMLRPSVRTRAVADALREMPEPDKVEEVLSDMAGPLDEAPREVYRVPFAPKTATTSSAWLTTPSTWCVRH